MDRRIHRDQATTNVLAWTATQSCNVEPSVEEEAGADTDEPPDCHLPQSPIQKHFTRAPVRRGSEQHESLLTKALQSNSDEESASARKPWRRRSVTSNISLASTADWTCDTGITTPARTSSPSPRIPAIGFVPIARLPNKANVTPVKDSKEAPQSGVQRPKDPAVQALEKKRCISFACAARPTPESKPPTPSPSKPAVEVVKASMSTKRTCIKFACTQPPQRLNITTPATDLDATTPVPKVSISTLVDEATPRPSKARSPSSTRLRSAAPRRSSRSPVATRSKKYLTANPGDLQSECARFHEFASDEPQEDDWIRQDDMSSKPKLTINDTLSRENAIRKLGKEAEEEAEQEEEEEDEDDEDDDDDDEDNDEDLEDVGDEDDEDDEGEDNEDDGSDVVSSKYDFRDGASDGYNTDNEVGFAESDDEDDDLVLWTTNFAMPLSISGTTPVCRRKSVDGQSESSGCSRQNSRVRRGKNRDKAPVLRPDTPELPDSTDFVCGTLDEDRPLEEAYISQLAARRQNKLLPIPQDIDPSFPTSEPEDEAEELYKKGYGDSDDHVWLHGELEDLHHERDRKGRKKKSDNPSPKRCRSPPPKRRHSPAPQARGRSDRRLFDRTSPQRPRSPAPRPALSASPAISPLHVGEGIGFESLAFRPGLTHTKSLPRPPDMFNHLNKSKKVKAVVENEGNENHVRGAIDIAKGLEQKRQRRKEKFYQKYCNQARKAKAQVRRPVPGQGAQRMREVGLIMAGKIGQGNYVLSV